MSLRGRKVLVTGASGFIGGRLVEKLILSEGAEVVCTTRNYRNLSRLARFKINWVAGDFAVPEVAEKAVQGCDVIFHCAYDFAPTFRSQKNQNLVGTTNLLFAAGRQKARFIHVSTIDVYGPTQEETLTESSERKPIRGDAYSQTKAAVEERVRGHLRSGKVEGVILQPSVVYGPFARTWSVNPVLALQQCTVILPESGSGRCNTIYIDDVVQAMLLAAQVKEATGETFLISGEGSVSWKEFYAAYETMLGETSTRGMTLEEIKSLRWRQLTSDSFRSILRLMHHQALINEARTIPLLQKLYGEMESLLPLRAREKLRASLIDDGLRPSAQTPSERPLYLPDLRRAPLALSKATISIEKARKVLGYSPKVSFSEGMRRTEAFLRWAKVIPSKDG